MSGCINTDISGIGVRSATYAQNLLSFLPAILALVDGDVDEHERDYLETQSTTILLSAFALLFSAIIQARTQTLDSHHATIVLNLSWMNNTNTFIYMLLLLHRNAWINPPDKWNWRRIVRAMFNPGERIIYGSPPPSRLGLGKMRRWLKRWADSVIVIGSLHLSLMGVLGFWVWLDPRQFDRSAACPTGAISFFAHTVPIESRNLRVLSLMVYSTLLTPVLNLLFAIPLLFTPYIVNLFRSPNLALDADDTKKEAKTSAARCVWFGLIVLFAINVVFIVDTELSIARTEGLQQDEDSSWSFGQTLALMLLILPLRDGLESLLQRRKAIEAKHKAVNMMKGYDDTMSWKSVKDGLRRIGGSTVDIHQLWLRRASAQGEQKIVEWILGRGTDGNDLEYNRDAVSDEALLIEKVHNKFGADVSRKTALHYAAEAGHQNIVECILSHTANIDIEAIDNQKKTVLHYASASGKAELVRFLLKRRANIQAIDANGSTALHHAARSGDFHVVEVLLSYDNCPSLDATDNDGNTPLYVASQSRHFMVVKCLVEHGAIDEDKKTALHAAYSEKYWDVVQVLVDHGARIKIDALLVASSNGDAEEVQLLLDRGADMTTTDSTERTSLHLASLCGHNEIVKLLLDCGADVTTTDCWQRTALHFASQYGHTEVASLLLDRGANVTTTGWQRTALHFASQHGHTEVAKLLLDHSADLTATTGGQQTALHLTSQHGHTEVAKLLLDRGADVTATDIEGQTALHLASQHGHTEVAELLLNRGADVTATERWQRTALHFAAQHGHTEVPKLLLNHGADVNTADDDQQTALHLASQHGHREVTKLLLDRGADVTATTLWQQTALHLASQHGHTEVAKLLLHRCTDLTATDHWQQTALHLASHSGCTEVAELLLDRCADVTATRMVLHTFTG